MKVIERERVIPSALSRPAGVSLLACAVLIIAAVGAIRLVQAIVNWNSLAGLAAVSPLYLALTGLLWTLTGIPLAIALWKGLPRSGWAARIFILLYSLYYWLDRLLVANILSRLDKGYDLPFLIVFNLLVLILFFGILSLAKVKAYLGEKDANQSKIE
ncbi:MAG: hypothetical protein ACM3PY_04265 [Omnitrophica WOR_2 bacterium]